MAGRVRYPAFALSVCVASCVAVKAGAETLRVPTAEYATIQRAIDFASDGDTVLVAPGEYVIAESIDFNRAHVPGDPESPPLKNLVVRSEGGAAVTTIRMENPIREFEFASVVVFIKGEGSESVLEGFRITGGSGSAVRLEGGGVITAGGGLLVDNRSSPSVRGCVIELNSSFELGGGLACANGATPTIIACEISSNTAGGGGGLLCYGASPVLRDCAIRDNLIGISGLPPVGGGAGVYCVEGAAPRFERCTISGNTAIEVPGGGLLAELDSAPLLVNTVVVGNASLEGGAFVCLGAALELESSTVADNLALAETGIIASSSRLMMRNSVVGELVVLERSELNASFVCSSRPKFAGDGNVISDPGFVQRGRWDPPVVDPTNVDPFVKRVWIDGDYRLRPTSACIDAGTSDGAPSEDRDGTPRPCGRGVDIGAYESDCSLVLSFRRGDCNDDERVDIADATCTLEWLFLGGDEPGCVAATNTNGDDRVDISDPSALLGYLFRGGAPPVEPFPDCDVSDLEADRRLGCALPQVCE